LTTRAPFTTIDSPQGTYDAIPIAINDSGEVAGSYSEDGDFLGFVYDKGTFTTIDPPGATYAAPTAINNSGELAGYYEDSAGNTHGFIASDPPGAPAATAAVTMSDVLTSQASQISMNDLVPGSAAISGQSAPGANSSGSVDNYPGANFGGWQGGRIWLHGIPTPVNGLIYAALKLYVNGPPA